MTLKEGYATLLHPKLLEDLKVNGIEPAWIPGKGIGMVATNDIHKGDILVDVPRSMMLTVDTVPRDFKDLFAEGLSVHGLLAAFLTHGNPDTSRWYGFEKVLWPTRQTFEQTMPILWPKRLWKPNSSFEEIDQDSLLHSIALPPAISGLWNFVQSEAIDKNFTSINESLLAQQERRLQESWKKVLEVFPGTDWDTYSYYWLIVNTRCYSYLVPGELPPSDENDAMALLPLVDLFNHGDRPQCKAKFDGEHYIFRALTSCKKGEEIYINYGHHSNDFLWVEYGFFLDTNEADAIYLNDIIFQDMTTNEKNELAKTQYHGKYSITNQDGPCLAVKLAAGLKCLGHSSICSDTCVKFPHENCVILGWVRTYAAKARTTLEAIQRLLAECDDDTRNKLKLLERRWKQIESMCDRTSMKLK